MKVERTVEIITNAGLALAANESQATILTVGHRRLNSANDYTQVDPKTMRSMAQTWPVR